MLEVLDGKDRFTNTFYPPVTMPVLRGKIFKAGWRMHRPEIMKRHGAHLQKITRCQPCMAGPAIIRVKVDVTEAVWMMQSPFML
ncbi:hypothetical protein WSS15_19590 [Acetobacter pasteurianus]|nr:hypothetical protein WSS15_19590 [Acetobacter pasteurianus]